MGATLVIHKYNILYYYTVYVLLFAFLRRCSPQHRSRFAEGILMDLIHSEFKLTLCPYIRHTRRVQFYHIYIYIFVLWNFDFMSEWWVCSHGLIYAYHRLSNVYIICTFISTKSHSCIYLPISTVLPTLAIRALRTNDATDTSHHVHRPEGWLPYASALSRKKSHQIPFPSTEVWWILCDFIDFANLEVSFPEPSVIPSGSTFSGS